MALTTAGGEGFKYVFLKVHLVDKATGRSILQGGKGYLRVSPGEVSVHPAYNLGYNGHYQHVCGTKQYMWLEWLVPDEQPPVVLSSFVVHGNAQRFVVEAMPLDAWPSHSSSGGGGGDFLKSYTFLPPALPNSPNEIPPSLAGGGKRVITYSDFLHACMLPSGFSPDSCSFPSLLIRPSVLLDRMFCSVCLRQRH